ncbi:ATP-binding protein [Streptomyces sp. FIT100]|nr:ATP-binding protein [Streptomyces sp. FIT100]
MRLSRLPHHKTLHEYDFAFQPDLDPRKVKDLATLSFVETKANAGLPGPPGFGRRTSPWPSRSQPAGLATRFTSPAFDDMVRNLTAAEAAGHLASKLGTYLRPSVLVVDEVGYQPLEWAEANLVFQVISKRNGARSSVTKSWPPPTLPGFSTTATPSRSTAPATGSRTRCHRARHQVA